VVALVGGAEWTSGCDFDAELLAASGGDEVLVLPTAAAYERPELAVATATEWFKRLGARVRPVMVLHRAEAEDESIAAQVREAGFVYLGGGSPLHLRSVLKDSLLWRALVDAWRNGAVLAGSSAGAMVFGDPMVDPRGGAFTLGLGLLENLCIVPHASTWPPERLRRTTVLAPVGVVIAAVDERTALIRAADGSWSVAGHGSVAVHVGASLAGLEALPR